MKRFVRIETRLWGDPTFSALSERAKVVYFFLTTHVNMLDFGGMQATLQGLAAELKWSLARFRKACLELEQTGWLYRSETAPLFWLPRHVRENRPMDLKDLSAMNHQLTWAPECELKPIIIQQIDEMFEEFDPPMRGHFRLAFRSILTDLENAELDAAELEAAKLAAASEPQPESETTPQPAAAAVAPPLEQRVTTKVTRSATEPVPASERPILNFDSTTDGIKIPKSLRSSQFHEVFHRWRIYLKEHELSTSRWRLESELRRLTSRGLKKAIADIEYSMERGLNKIKSPKPEPVAAAS